MKILFIIPCKKSLPSGLVRVMQYVEYLEKAGIDYKILEYVSPLSVTLEKYQQQLLQGNSFVRKCLRHVITHCINLLRKYHSVKTDYKILRICRRYDAVFFQWLAPGLEIISKLRDASVPIIYDFDDAVFLESPERTETIVKNSFLVVAGSHFNYDYAIQHNSDTVIIPSSVPIEKYIVQDTRTSPPAGEPLRIGWIGSVSTMKYLRIVIEPLVRLSALGYQFELLIAGTWKNKKYLPDLKGLSFREVPFYSGDDIPRLVSEFDIGVMPIDDTPWERGKCAMKALIYMAGAKPVVSSNVGEACYILRDGENGYLASSPEEWENKIRILLDNPAIRIKIGLKGRETVEAKYSTAYCFKKLYDEVFSRIPVNGANARK